MQACDISQFAESLPPNSLTENLKTIDNLSATRDYPGKVLVITGGKDTRCPRALAKNCTKICVAKKNPTYLWKMDRIVI